MASCLTVHRDGRRPSWPSRLKAWSSISATLRNAASSDSESGRISALGERPRYVHLSQELVQTLGRLCAERERKAMDSQCDARPDWVFVNGRSRPFDDSRIRKRFRRLARLAGIANHRVYDLRHTFATLLLSKSAPITYVASQLGHTNPTTTLRWYAHWLPSDAARYVDFLDTDSGRDRHQIGTNDDFAELDEENPLDFTGGPSETRTPDPLIKSQLLYQLS
jgi:integrase